MQLSAIADLDHLMMAVFDHEKAIAAYSRLCFQVRPVRQLPPMGGGAAGGNGGSAAILLHSRAAGCANYLEIARADPETAMPIMQEILCRQEGPAMLVHATLDPDNLFARWTQLGIAMQRIELVLQPFGEGPPVDLQVFLVEPNQAAFNFNACWYSDPYDFERDEWRDHPNGALHWDGLSIPIDDDLFDKSVKRFSVIYGLPAVLDHCGCATFTPGFSSFKLYTKSSYRFLYGHNCDGGMVHLIVKSVQLLSSYLSQNGIDFERIGSKIKVDGSDANGSHLLFEEI